MPRKAPLLTALQVKHLGNGSHNIGGVTGTYIFKSPAQSYFYYRYTDASGKRRELSLGLYPDMSLAEVRKAAFTAQEQLKNGIDPLEHRRHEALLRKQQFEQQTTNKITTFEKIALEWVADRANNGYWIHNAKGERETTQILRNHIFPDLGKLDIESISPENVRDCLSRIWQHFPSTARKARSYTHKIFQWAIALNKRQNRENPANMDGPLGVLMEPLQRNKKSSQNHAACAVDEIPRLFQEMSGFTSMSARACEFAILTAARSQAVRLAQWSEFDLDKGIWTIPIDHDKIKAAARDRTIFLSPAAIALLKSLPRFRESPYVFPSSHGSHFSDVALTMFLRGLHQARLAKDGRGWIDPEKTKLLGKPCVITIHGTARSTFRTWAKDDSLGNNRRFDQEAVELCLLHMKNDGYNGAYDRARLPKERRLIMEAWGEYCTSKVKATPKS